MSARTRASSPGGAVTLYERYIASVGGFQGEGAVVIGTSGHVFYSPIIIPYNLTIDGLGCLHGGVAAGNFYLAIYDHLNELPRNRLGVTASTLNAGVNQKQLVPLTVATLQLNAGLHYLAIEQDNATDSHWSNQPTGTMMYPFNVNNGPSWFRELLGGYLPPPAVATPIQDGTCNTFFLFIRVASIP